MTLFFAGGHRTGSIIFAKFGIGEIQAWSFCWYSVVRKLLPHNTWVLSYNLIGQGGLVYWGGAHVLQQNTNIMVTASTFHKFRVIANELQKSAKRKDIFCSWSFLDRFDVWPKWRNARSSDSVSKYCQLWHVQNAPAVLFWCLLIYSMEHPTKVIFMPVYSAT